MLPEATLHKCHTDTLALHFQLLTDRKGKLSITTRCGQSTLQHRYTKLTEQEVCTERLTLQFID